MSYVLARCARGKIKANNMADVEEEILLQANLFFFSPKATTSQLQNLRIRKIFMKRQDKLNFSPPFSQLLEFLCLSLKRTHTAQLCSMPAMFKANERCYNRTFGLYGLETLNHRSELKILWDTFRSQIAELWFPYDRRIANDCRR